MRKVVVSTSGEVADWRNSDVLPTISRKLIDQLKREPGGNIVIYGSVSVINALSALNLVDEYHLLLHPIVLRKGRPLFDNPVKLELKSAEPLNSGVVLTRYEARDDGAC
jgi:Dihydrofolate reductase